MNAASKKFGDLIECSDPAIREYILYINGTLADSKKFVQKDLPPKHLLVNHGTSPFLNEMINSLVDTNTFLEENRQK